MVERLQSRLHPLSAYVVLPVFALANAGVNLGGGVLGEALDSTVALGIAAGPGHRQAGRHPARLLRAIRLGLGQPARAHHLADGRRARCVAGIGFTVSIFIAGLSFPGAEHLPRTPRWASSAPRSSRLSSGSSYSCYDRAPDTDARRKPVTTLRRSDEP